MDFFEDFSDTNVFFYVIPIIILDIILRGIALWKSSRNSQKVWFVFLLIANSLGILPLAYLLFFQKKVKKL